MALDDEAMRQHCPYGLCDGSGKVSSEIDETGEEKCLCQYDDEDDPVEEAA